MEDEQLELGFWGLIVQPNKTYTQTVDASFRLSMAALGNVLPEGGSRTCLTVTVDKKRFVLCSLTPEKIEQCPLDHLFRVGEEITFSAIGNCPIHLTGYYIPPDFDDEDLDDLEGYSDLEDGEDMDDDEEGEEDDEEEDDEEEEEEEPAPKANQQPKKRPAPTQEAQPNKKHAAEGANAKPQQAKGQQGQQGQPKEKQGGEAAPAKKTLQNGLILEDLKVGKGKVAKKGSKLSMRYTGKLANGSTFDSNTKGEPFSFTLGKGEVIKGWDLGIEGMSEGGERKITIPPALAYGNKGAPPQIPKNATLSFVVKLLNVKN